MTDIDPEEIAKYRDALEKHSITPRDALHVYFVMEEIVRDVMQRAEILSACREACVSGDALEAACIDLEDAVDRFRPAWKALGEMAKQNDAGETTPGDPR